MKWPEYLALIRHDVSAYNVLRDKKRHDPLYKEFLAAYAKDPSSATTRALAQLVADKYSLGVSDANTPLADEEGPRAFNTGKGLKAMFGKKELPDIIFVSPYLRTRETLRHIKRGWPELDDVKTLIEERIREQEHGLSLLYNDWRVFFALHPEQRLLHELLGPYWYKYPQGECVPMVRERNRSWMTTLTRDFAEKRILAVTHHLNILGIRANLERWDSEQFIVTDEHDKPKNCSLTLYRGKPTEGKNGRFKLELYNKRLH